MDEQGNQSAQFSGPFVVSRLDVRGFWKDRNLKIPFDRQVNFLIGPNGSGKTTIVNLLAAAMTADLRVLDRIDFSEATIELSPASAEGGVVLVEVKKERSTKLPLPQLSYRIFEPGTTNEISFSLDDIEEQLAVRDPRYYRRRLHNRNNLVGEVLSDLTDISWLSVHRHEFVGASRDSTAESLVDAKLESQSNQLVRYLSRLDQRAADVLRQFQQGIFLNLLANPDTNFDLWDKFDFDIGKDRLEFIQILDQFKVQRSRYQSRIEKHFDLLKVAQEKASGRQGLETRDIVALVNQRRIHEVVAEWTDAVLLQQEVFRTRDAFLSVLNSMLINKEVFITNTNEVAVRTLGGTKSKTLTVKHLSSGEKQLLIIMTQALLQDSRPSVFIADEPELSLHVAWQERLVDNIRRINPGAQIIFATHSPDVVGSHLDRVIESHEVFVS